MALLKPAALSFLLILATAVQADPVLQSILAESAKAPVVGFERTTRAELRADPAKEPGVIVDRFTPTSANAGTWTMLSVDGRKPTPREQEAHAKGNGNPPGFHNLHRLLAGQPTRRTEADGKTHYFWDSLPKGSVITPGGDISSHISAEAVVDHSVGKPALREVRLFAAKPFHVKIVASVNKFNVVSTYRPGANGGTFLVAQTNDTDVTAPMGMGGKKRSVVSFRPL